MAHSVKKILVLCTGNSCRSQMAEGYLKHFAQGKAKIYSAGLEPHGLNARAVEVMKQDGIDISHQFSTHVDEYKNIDFDFVITVCDHANEQCPFLNTKAKRFHQNFIDPSKLVGSEYNIQLAFTAARDHIKIYCQLFVSENL